MALSPRARALLAGVFALILLVSPMRLVWAHPGRSWLTPFVLWGGVLLLTAWVGRTGGGRDA